MSEPRFIALILLNLGIWGLAFDVVAGRSRLFRSAWLAEKTMREDSQRRNIWLRDELDKANKRAGDSLRLLDAERAYSDLSDRQLRAMVEKYSDNVVALTKRGVR